MHKDVYIIDKVEKPKGNVNVIYFSSKSNNTHRFVEKLDVENLRIPLDINEKISINKDYILICPTYSGGGNDTKGAVPKQVIKFLNDEVNRKHCKGVVASGNTNFGDTFCLAGIVLSKKLNVPLLYQFELLGTNYDVENLKEILNKFWE